MFSPALPHALTWTRAKSPNPLMLVFLPHIAHWQDLQFMQDKEPDDETLFFLSNTE
jgi:hypothetical protein